MSGISDDLREFAKRIEGYEYIEYVGHGGKVLGAFEPRWFNNLANRIDAETVALPKDGDGNPIHPGDIKYRITNGDMCKIYTIAINSGGAYVTAMVGGGTGHEADVMDLDPCKLTSKANVPDSLERIVNDIADFGIGADIDNATLEFLVKIQKRICQIAKESKR